MKKIAVLLTSYNRRDYTEKCIVSLCEGNKNIDFRFVVTDDNSSDNTVEMLEKLPAKVHIIRGDGNLFYAGGMRKSMSFALKYADRYDYVLLVNDDVDFYPNAIEKLVDRLESLSCDVVVGSTCEKDGTMSYGGVSKRSKHFAKFDLILPSENPVLCDTFNCNCVLLKASVFEAVGNMDEGFVHSMADYDYGLMISEKGYIIVNSSEHIGNCADNNPLETWRNPALPRKERMRLKESPKGLPYRDWFHFVRKHYGLIAAVYHTITPYMRILLKK